MSEVIRDDGSARNGAETPSQSPLILIAEDDPKTLRLVGEVVQRAGYRAALAKHGVGAVKLLKRARPDLIILDLRMPRMDGFQLLELLKKYETSASIPVVVLTGSNSPMDIDRAMQLGITDYLVKPISPRKLITRIQKLLR
ncbi:MAG: response regulator [Myxococcales bacterium]|nr:response regulator [Myxococcales bacterium]|tara:strand:+ start:2435 stop:2857 length:423 start_codon:yes stop_codon:yes gene_type:complete